MACDPQSLIDQARGLSETIPEGMQLPVAIVLAAQIGSLSTDPATLLKAAEPYQHINPGLQLPIANYLACQIMNL